MTVAEPEGRSESALASVNEAAFVAGVSARTVNQAIDRDEIRTYALIRGGNGPGRGLRIAEIVYLSVQGVLSSEARREFYRALAGCDLDDIPRVVTMQGEVLLDIRRPLAEVHARLDELERTRSRVQVDPEIRGGEPVFRGTRIPVHMIAEFLRKGVPRAELLEDYPSLDEESLEVALRYAELYPRRGRPREAPWRSQEPTHRFSPEQLEE